MLDLVQAEIERAAKAAFPDHPHLDVEIKLATQENFGHYQCNSAMKWTKELKLPPRQIAEKLILFPSSLFEKMEVAGPGFINITLKPSFIAQMAEKIGHDPHLGIALPEKKRVIVEFSSPNTAKELHVGHLRSTIIGDALARIFEFLGHDVLRLNHIGDWGTQFGMLIAYMKEKAPATLKGETPTTLTDLVKWYKESKERFDADPSFKKHSQLEVVALQGGHPESLKAWALLCDISRKAYQEIYDLLDIRLKERGESFYNPSLPHIVAELTEKGLVEVSNGAKCIFLDGFINREGEPLPLMIQKSDGGYNYDTTDMAAIKQRIEEEKADRIIIVTDAGQAQHFAMIFKAAEKAGWLNPAKTRMDHVPFGLVLGADGKKFKTRSGDTEKLIDLLTEAVERAYILLKEKNPSFSEDELNVLAKKIGLGAIKYADLSCNRTGDYVFSYDKMLRFEGNTAAYLLYSYVRINGIKRKVGRESTATHLTLTHPTEIALALHLTQFGDTIQKVTEELLPNRLTDYLYTLAEKFHAFFRDCRVEGAPEQESRLLLCSLTATVMKTGLYLIGLQTVEKM